MPSGNILPSLEDVGFQPSAPRLDHLNSKALHAGGYKAAPGSKSLYPSLPAEAGNLRLKKIRYCQRELKNEISHYQKVTKRYERVKAVRHTTSSIISVMTALLSMGSFSVTLSGVGVVACFSYRLCLKKNVLLKMFY